MAFQEEPRHLIHYKAQLQDKRMPVYKKIIRWTWRLLGVAVALVLIGLLMINFMAIPSFRELEDPNSAVASEVLANNGEVLGRYFIENRVPVSYDELNPWLVKALIATEDERFRNHSGVDMRAVGRVAIRTVLMRDQSAGGGSTITQQLAKMLYSDRNFKGMSKGERLLTLFYWKIREWITAVKLERSYTKEEIIAMYLNQFNFINNSYGIQAASEVYFGKPQDKLRPEEAATLVGMLQNPSYFNPVRFPERSVKRRYVVLSQMRRNGYLTEEQFAKLKVAPLDMSKFKRVNFTGDRAPYLTAELKKDINRLLDLPESRKSDGTKYNIYKDGLKIYTTIDPVYQQHAEAAVSKHMAKIQSRFFQVWKNRDPWRYKSRETTDEEIDMRLQSLNSLILTGDRYQEMRPKYFDELEKQVEEKFSIPLRDIDIERMLQEEKQGKSIAKMVARKEVNADQAVAYRQIMQSSLWPEIKKQWNALQAGITKAYNQKTKMKVFSWNSPQLERDTLMSPLDSIRYHRMFLQTGLLAVDPLNNEIKAWVGGINFKYFQFDHIRSMRQVGSTFKPFVYATAISQQGISPCMKVYDQPVTIPARYQSFTTIADWTPKNATGVYSWNHYTLKDALKNSVNSISAYLMKQMGDTEPVRGLVHNLGIDSTLRRPDGGYRLPKQPAIALGAADLTVLEMTGAYAAFAHNGMFTKPYVIKKIEDKNGKVIYRSLPSERVALAANANYVMLHMLKYNVAGAPGINSLKSEVGGKTGTTNDYSDGWFMGVTPRLVVGTWVGGEDRWIRFLSLNDGQGARMARPIFAGFIENLERDPKSGYDYNARFEKPVGDLGIELDCAKYSQDNYGDTETETFGDEEDFSPDTYNDELPDGEAPKPENELNPNTPKGVLPKGGEIKPKPKKPDEGFGG